ncbi:MAG TPA: hypothetical protein PKD54_05335 [Pirellulaceae bacterium]|nr:hypothetical protein [Pirellulaceae bacterium]
MLATFVGRVVSWTCVVVLVIASSHSTAQQIPGKPSTQAQPAAPEAAAEHPPVHIPAEGFRVIPNRRHSNELISDQPNSVPPREGGFDTRPGPRQMTGGYDQGIRRVQFTQDEQPPVDQEVVVASEPLLPPAQALSVMNQQGAIPFGSQNTNQGLASPPVTPSGTFNQSSQFPSFGNASPMPESDLPRMVAHAQGNAEEEAKHSATHFIDSNAYSSRPVLANETALVQLEIPAIRVEAYGPSSLGLHKKSQLRIVARNFGQAIAENVVVSVVLPAWVQISNLNAEGGRRELVDELGGRRVQWTIDRLAAQSEIALHLDVVATKAESFTCQLAWAIQPPVRQSMITVTEPRLEMKIAGPREVLFGETESYHVTIRNPGTGTAERIVVMLPEALGGQREELGDLAPGEERKFKVELLAKTAGLLDLTTRAVADGNIQTSDTARIMVRRPAVQITLAGPEMAFAGSVAQFEIVVSNPGDAMAREVMAAIALPRGIRYISGIDTAEVGESHLRWSIGSLDAGEQRTYRIACQMNADGPVNIEAAVRGASDIANLTHCTTHVETVADVVLSVDEPAGPSVTGTDVEYTIRIKNRGSRAARNLNLVMQFDEGIEPSSTAGHRAEIVPGQVLFAPINELAPGAEMTVSVLAKGQVAGTHLYRVQLESGDKETRKVAEGTSKFYGDQALPRSTGNSHFGSGGIR